MSSGSYLRGYFQNTGLKSGYKGLSTETILLVQIRDNNENLISDHLWFNLTKGFEQLRMLKKGTIIQFIISIMLIIATLVVYCKTEGWAPA